MKSRTCALYLVLCLGITALNLQAETEPFFRLNLDNHQDGINGLSLDPTGRMLLTVSSDRTAKLRDAVSGDLIRIFLPPLGYANSGKLLAGAFSPDGKMVAVGGQCFDPLTTKYRILFFETSSGDLLGQIGGLAAVSDLRFSPDGRLLAVGTYRADKDPGVLVYALSSTLDGGFIKTDKEPVQLGGSTCLDFSADGRLVTGGLDGTLRLYSPDLKLVKESKSSTQSISGLDFSPEGKLVAVARYGSSRIEVLDSGDLGFLYAPASEEAVSGDFSRIAFSADGKRLYAAGTARKADSPQSMKLNFIRWWNESGKSPGGDVIAGIDTVTGLRAFRLPDGGSALAWVDAAAGLGVLGQDNRIRMRKLAAWMPPSSDIHASGINQGGTGIEYLGIDPDGRGITQAFDLAEHQVLDALKKKRSISWNREGIRLDDVGTNHPGINGKVPAFFADGSRIARGADISGKGLVVFALSDGLVCLDKYGNVLWQESSGQTCDQVLISGDNKAVAALCHNGQVSWISMEPGQEFSITLVVAGSLAEKSGIQAGDTILAVDGKSFASLPELLAYLKPLNTYRIGIRRQGQQIEKVINKQSPSFGMVLIPASRVLASLYLNPDGLRWVVWTPDGFYDCAPGAENLVAWQIGQGSDKSGVLQGPEAWHPQYFRPDLVREVFATWKPVRMPGPPAPASAP